MLVKKRKKKRKKGERRRSRRGRRGKEDGEEAGRDEIRVGGGREIFFCNFT